jgi:hypothetical protein
MEADPLNHHSQLPQKQKVPTIRQTSPRNSIQGMGDSGHETACRCCKRQDQQWSLRISPCHLTCVLGIASRGFKALYSRIRITANVPLGGRGK